MKADWKAFTAGLLVWAVLTARALAQAPTPASNASSPAAAAAPPAAAGTPAPSSAGGIVGMFQMIAAKKAACKAKLCACPIGQLFTNMLKPINAMTGGLLCTSCCDDLKQQQDQQKPSTSAQGACAKITAEEAEMKARRDAVRCLAHVDCHWWPEAEESLINALRTDRNECVRMEAALALGTGCCCTKKTIEALTIVVTGSDKDGNPYENSERVKAIAAGALQHCLACHEEQPQRPEVPKPLKPEEPPKATPTAAQTNGIQLTGHDAQSNQKFSADIVVNARQALQQVQAAPGMPAHDGPPTGRRNVSSLLAAAMERRSYKLLALSKEPMTTGDDDATLSAPTTPAPLAAEPRLTEHSPAATPRDLLLTLCYSPDSARRESAARSLAAADPGTMPELVPMLTTTASRDPVARVRSECVRTLARWRISTPPVLAALHSLQNDADREVRQAADEALAQLSSRTPASVTPAARTTQAVLFGPVE